MCVWFSGGEPLLAGLSFYRQFVSCVRQKKKEKQQVFYTIQTNGMTLDDQWISFFKEENFLLGVSWTESGSLMMKTGWITAGRGLFRRYLKI